jgi:hypothetical protein
VAEGGGLLNRYRVVKPYRGFESLRLRQTAINLVIYLRYAIHPARLPNRLGQAASWSREADQERS